jgi:hypothetical protein
MKNSRCVSSPEQKHCITGKACDHCNIILHITELSSTLDKVYTLLLLQSNSIQTTFGD